MIYREYTKKWLDSILEQHQYILVVDIEHTCTTDDSIPPSEREIIEIGAVVVCAKSLEGIDSFQSLVKPVQHPNLSEFCIQLTGIQQENLDSSQGFEDVFNEFKHWLTQYDGYLFSSWGAYDCVQLNLDCQYHNVEPLNIKLVFNIKKAFAKTQKIKPRAGMRRALNLASLTLDGDNHRGLDDAKNIVRLLPYAFGRKAISYNHLPETYIDGHTLD